MFATIRPWGPVALILAATGVVLAPLAGLRGLTLTAAALGLVAALSGLVAARNSRTLRDWAWPALGAALSAAVLCLTQFAPGLLNPLWAIDAPVPAPDTDRLVRVPADRPLDAGRALEDEEWVDFPTDGIRQDDLLVAVKAVRLAESGGKNLTGRLHVHLSLYQVRPGRMISFFGFARDRHAPALTDGSGRPVAFVGHHPERFSAALDLVPLHLDHILVFEAPPAGTESLKLAVPASAWGQNGVCRFRISRVEREAPPALAEQLAHFKKLLRRPPPAPPDAALGRALFYKHCRECHTLFGTGGNTGPDLTPSKRNDLDFLLTSIIEPSAEIAKGFEASQVITSSGRIINGIIKDKESTDAAITVQAQGAKVVVPRRDIEEILPSKVSLMPTELLKGFDEHDVRSLIGYLSGPAQVPMLARPETVVFFSAYGATLEGWQRTRGEWRVEQGEIVAAAPRGGQPHVLMSEMLVADDFRVSFRFHPGQEGRGALVLSGEGRPGPTTLRAELTAGRSVALAAGAHVRAESAPGADAVKADAWNQVEVRVVGRRVQVRLNGRDAVALDDAGFAGRCTVALEGAAAAGQEVRFTRLSLQLGPPEKGE
jgi:putative heme-binding domain-containing protein